MGTLYQRCAPLLLAIMALAGCSASDFDGRDQAALVAMGEAIFSDRTFSVDQTVSCADCHRPEQYFTDGRPLSIGSNGRTSTRNAPSLLDAQVASTFFWDGRATRLEEAVLQPFTNPVELGLAHTDLAVQRINGSARYAPIVASALDTPEVQLEDIGAALAAYIQSLPLQPTRYDHYLASGGETGLTGSEAAGLLLFTGKAGCAECHSLQGTPVALTDNRFHHIGVGFERLAGNVAAMIATLEETLEAGKPLGEAVLVDPSLSEMGRFAVTRRPADLGAFRTPTLRNVAHTSPYMHDGSVPTLQAAVEQEIYYRSLSLGRPINLTSEEQMQLIAFLGALSTDPSAKSMKEKNSD